MHTQKAPTTLAQEAGKKRKVFQWHRQVYNAVETYYFFANTMKQQQNEEKRGAFRPFYI